MTMLILNAYILKQHKKDSGIEPNHFVWTAQKKTFVELN